MGRVRDRPRAYPLTRSPGRRKRTLPLVAQGRRGRSAVRRRKPESPLRCYRKVKPYARPAALVVWYHDRMVDPRSLVRPPTGSEVTSAQISAITDVGRRTARYGLYGGAPPVARSRRELQRQHEDYWGMHWAIPLGQHLNAPVRWRRPDEDPPDTYFCVRGRDGTEVLVWGELTGVYLDDEAKWLWGEDNRGCGGWWEPDVALAIKAREQVERKRRKYLKLARRRGPGHLLVLLLSPLTARSTRIKVEQLVRELLESAPGVPSDPFETVWLGYRLPHTTPDEQEDPRFAFRDRTDWKRFNFMKCIWIRPHLPGGVSLRPRAGEPEGESPSGG